MVTLGQRSRTALQKLALAAIRCSQLSSTSSACHHVVGARQLDPPGAVGPVVGCGPHELRRQARFAGAARADDRHQPRLPEQALERAQLRVPTDELRQRLGQTFRARHGGRRVHLGIFSQLPGEAKMRLLNETKRGIR